MFMLMYIYFLSRENREKTPAQIDKESKAACLLSIAFLIAVSIRKDSDNYKSTRNGFEHL